MLKNLQLTGKQSFLLLWFGQFISIIGSSMTNFALLIWAYQNYGTALSVATLGFVYFTPYILISPFAGVVVDKMNTKRILLISDICAALSTALLFTLFITNHFNFWFMCLAQLIAGLTGAFQEPAQQLAITMIVPKEYYLKANGLRSFSSSSSKILAPIFAGALMVLVGIKGVMVIDILTFIFACVTLLLFITIPERQRKTRADEAHKKSNFLEEMKFGFKYIYERKGLFWLLMFFIGINLIAAITYYSILPAMILARSNNNEVILGTVQAALGIGGVVGSILVTTLTKLSKKSKVFLILFSAGASFITGDVLMSIGNNVFLWSTAAFMASVFIPFLMGNENALWQSKVDPSVQGRVFSIKNTVQLASMPAGYLIGGLLADKVFEPAMNGSGLLHNLFSGIVGSSSGSGMALMFFFTGITGMLICIFAYLNDEVRNLETKLPDHGYIPEHF